MNQSATTSRVPIGQLVGKLRALPVSAFDQVEQVRSLLAEMPVAEPSLAHYLTWDRQHYTRNLIDKTPLYELVAICWEVGQASSIHNHHEQNCWMAVPIGRLRVENYRTISQNLDTGSCELETSNTVEMNPRQPCAVDPQEPVHRVYNPGEFNQRAVSLHVYSRPFDTCVVYSQQQRTCGVIKLHYQTEYGKPVKNN